MSNLCPATQTQLREKRTFHSDSHCVLRDHFLLRLPVLHSQRSCREITAHYQFTHPTTKLQIPSQEACTILWECVQNEKVSFGSTKAKRKPALARVPTANVTGPLNALCKQPSGPSGPWHTTQWPSGYTYVLYSGTSNGLLVIRKVPPRGS